MVYSSVGIASIFQITQTRNYDPSVKELPYQLALSMAWGNVEVHLAVFVGKNHSLVLNFDHELLTRIKALLLCFDQYSVPSSLGSILKKAIPQAAPVDVRA